MKLMFYERQQMVGQGLSQPNLGYYTPLVWIPCYTWFA
jgi:hypothetical protein